MVRIEWNRERWEELAPQARYNAGNLAKLCNLSVRQLERDFRRVMARSPQDWLDERRIEAAGRRLLAGEPVKKVAFDLGFKQSTHFFRQFKRHSGSTPSQFVLANFCDKNGCRSGIANGV
jgi:AraC-like DNA-binding protein